jgi:hypothetical protein
MATPFQAAVAAGEAVGGEDETKRKIKGEAWWGLKRICRSRKKGRISIGALIKADIITLHTMR